jgi:hypothetical protein
VPRQANFLTHEVAMLACTLDHLLADEDSLDPIGDEHEEHSRYLNRCRRICFGPGVAVVFENSRTLRSRLRELARLARATHPGRVHREIAWYDSLLPGPGRLLASISVRAANRDIARRLEAGQVELRIGDRVIPGRVRSDSGGDRVIGLVRWVEFALTRQDRLEMQDRDRPLTLAIRIGDDRYSSDALPPAVRTSLLSDLDPQKN